MSTYLTILGASLLFNAIHVAVTGEPFMITLP